MTLRYLRENVEFAVGQVRDGDSNYCQNGYLYSHTCLCSVLGHWRGICLLVNPHVLCSVLGHWRGICLLVNPHFCVLACHLFARKPAFFVFCLGSLAWHLFARKPTCFVFCLGSLAWHLFARKPTCFVFCLGSLAWHLFARKPTCFVFLPSVHVWIVSLLTSINMSAANILDVLMSP